METNKDEARQAEARSDFVIAQSKKVLALVDDYIDGVQTQATRQKIRSGLMRQFEQLFDEAAPLVQAAPPPIAVAMTGKPSGIEVGGINYSMTFIERAISECHEYRALKEEAQELRFAPHELTASAALLEGLRRRNEAAANFDFKGWVRWAGGECPIVDGEQFHVQLRNGVNEDSEAPDDYHWQHTGSGGDIIAFKLTAWHAIHPSPIDQAAARDAALEEAANIFDSYPDGTEFFGSTIADILRAMSAAKKGE